MMRDEVLSVMLGYTSIACWLGAQFPQIVVNWRRKSVDGLAFPFLVNWFFGDATNLIGCLLTNQLPFQTYVATYFVFVDFCLITQYFYYDAPKDVKALSTLRSRSRTSSLIRPSSISYSQAHTLPRTNLSRSRSRSYSMDPQLGAAVASASIATSELEPMHPGLHALEADRASHARWRTFGNQRGRSLEGLPESVVADLHVREWEERRASREGRESDAGNEAVDIESESLMDSFYSEGGARGRGRGKRVSWSPSQDRSGRRLSNDMQVPESQPAAMSSSDIVPSTVRGRQLTRPIIYDTGSGEELSSAHSEVTRTRKISTASTVSAAASRRSAGIVFLGVFALIGLSNRAGYRMRGDIQGRVLTEPQGIVPSLSWKIPPSVDPSPNTVFLTFGASFTRAPSDAETRLLIGRVSAWICTTLYLTSRLPQIWKNFVRKSVEGLSMYLFIFAFLGNLFYVLSILTSPKMNLPAKQAAQFLRSSIPYLLGSGGTLIFDVTIVTQSFIYPKPPSNIRRRRKSLINANADEERALLVTGTDN